jgi:hypothetical protein
MPGFDRASGGIRRAHQGRILISQPGRPARGLTLGSARWTTPSSRGDEEDFEDEIRSTMRAAGPEGVTG